MDVCEKMAKQKKVTQGFNFKLQEHEDLTQLEKL